MLSSPATSKTQEPYSVSSQAVLFIYIPTMTIVTSVNASSALLVMLLLGRAVAGANTTTSSGSTPPPPCEYGWQQFRDKCFHFLGTSSSHTFDEAKYECSKYFRASLAMIKSEEEQRFVEGLLKQSTIYNNVWLGAKWMPETLLAKAGYHWIDESPVFYHNKLLSPDLIKGNASMCLAMFMQTQYFGIWTPFNCNFYFHVLCERSLNTNSGLTLFPAPLHTFVPTAITLLISTLLPKL